MARVRSRICSREPVTLIISPLSPSNWIIHAYIYCGNILCLRASGVRSAYRVGSVPFLRFSEIGKGVPDYLDTVAKDRSLVITVGQLVEVWEKRSMKLIDGQKEPLER
jgi:hypothetical protein